MDTTDLVPAELRAQWVADGHCPGVDLMTLFSQQVDRHPDRVALVDDHGSVTYAELAAEARRIGAYLHQAGVGPGDVVAIQFANTHHACAADLAVASVGAICLAYPILYRNKEVRSLLARSGAVACLFARRFRDFDFAEMMVELRGELPGIKHLAVLGEPFPGCDSLDEVLAGPDPGVRPPVEVGPADPVRIIVTSGTEGEPKMVLFSHDGIGGGIANVLGAILIGGHPPTPAGPDKGPGRPDDDTRFLLLPPLSTGFGALGTYAAISRFGVTLVVTSVFDPAGMFKLIERERITHLFGVPTMLGMMLEAKPEGVDLSSLQVVGSFGAAMSEDRVRRTIDVFSATPVAMGGGAGAPTDAAMSRQAKSHEGRARFVNGYGCSDGAICMTGWDDPPEKIAATVGRPSPALSHIRILDDDGADVPEGEVGEVCARGPMTPLRYFKSPDLDDRYRFDGGWVRTGDLGVIDADGYLRIAGRKKDIIIRGGYNISPAEAEAALLTHPAVAEAACVGMPDERLGERMCAFLVLREGQDLPDLAEIEQHLTAAGLARIKCPERLEAIDAMPLNPTGKILKRVLRDRIAEIVGTGARA
ncbi:MAG: class I adenylate-forming enzyme family protein [Acidimicrobiia bacterium]